MTADQSPDKQPFGIRFSRDSQAARKKLPVQANHALADIVDQLFEDATDFLQHGRKHPRDPKLNIYSQANPPLEITYEVDLARRIIAIRHVVSPELEEKKPLFISYSRKDRKWKETLLTWLADIDRELITIWHDGKIEPGTTWNGEINDAMRSAKAAVLLVTQDFLASDYVSKVEMPTLIELMQDDRLTILWIAVKRSRYKSTPLADIEALNDPQKPLFALRGDYRDSAFEKISAKIVERVMS
jgi:hypothetical protein